MGAVIGALVLPKARQKIRLNTLVNGLTFLFAAAMIAVAYSRNGMVACAAMICAGIAWLILLTIFNTSIQLSVPSWVRGRVLAFYLLVLFGGMAGGGVLCGIVAEWAGVTRALLATGIVMAASVALTGRRKLLVEEEKDITPSMHWLTPMAVIEPQPGHGPVLVMVEYRIDPERGEEFAALMQDIGRIRRRDGAFIWNLSRDLAAPGRYVELFFVESWAEHLRQHERVTIADREVEDKIKALHIGGKPPVVSHLISAYNVYTDR
jgi:MFS family permease